MFEYIRRVYNRTFNVRINHETHDRFFVRCEVYVSHFCAIRKVHWTFWNYVTIKFPTRKPVWPVSHQSRIRRDWNLTPANATPAISDNVTEFQRDFRIGSRKCYYVYRMHTHTNSLIVFRIYLHAKNDFAEISKTLAR